MLRDGVGDCIWAGGSEREEIGGSRDKLTGVRKRAERGIAFLRTGGPMDLRQVASGSATRCLWLRQRKV